MTALKYKPTKLDERVLEKISEDVKKGKFPSENNAINEILKKHYSIKPIPTPVKLK